MPTVIKSTWAPPEYPYQPLNRARIDGSFDDGTDSRIVMAEQIPQDVVKQEQSVDDPSSTGVSATEPTEFTAHAVLEKTSSLSNPEQDLATLKSLRTEPPVPVQHQVVDIEVSGFTSKLSVVAVQLNLNDPDGAPTSQDYILGEEPPNSETQDFDTIEEDSARGAGVDESASSDTDNSRVDTAEVGGKELGDGQEQARPNALKKSATFKPVSVTKNFLAKAGTTTTPTTKQSTDKANGAAGGSSTSALQSAPRPRLVAKSASGHRNAVPKALNMTSKMGRGSGPDPNQVWNRNRVATPQATPKHLTDEELRQQYGIQLASRPQEDADGKEAKWADIDDDEDDWAPETIEWNDGTKINLSQVDHTAALAQEQAAAAAAREKEAEAAKPRPLVSRPTTTVGPNATVLKLGSSTQPKSGSLVLKGPSEKPTLVAKPSTSNQVKSPWASLPPVDKISPVPINPPIQTPTPRFAQRDIHGFDAMPAQPVHAKEIAADDFSRSSRETPNGIPKELFNSQSGRYEPVNETRRGSTIRKEQNFRAPSVLQRPTQNDQHGPAEPSAAFQTSRSGQQETASWNRRRTSSNVSGDGGNFGRRSSIGKGFDIPRVPADVSSQRRDSQYEQSPLTPGTHSARHVPRDASPVQSHGQSITSQSPTMAASQAISMSDSAVASPHQSHVLPIVPSTPTSAAFGANPDDLAAQKAAQKKLMHEKREAAIKRRAEEDAKEEAERRERIRVKMEKLGLANDKKGKRETAEESLATSTITKESQETPKATPLSPPKPPVPNISGAPQQYGLMKVHASHPVNNPPMLNGPTDKKHHEPTLPKVDILPTEATTLPTPVPEASASTFNGNIDERPVEKSSSQSPDHIQNDAVTDSGSQPWKSMPQGPNGYSTWNNSGMTTHSSPGGNLWGPPTNHRALGNGDFQSNVQRPQSRPAPYQSHIISPPPQPIGTPRHLQQARESLVQGSPRPPNSSVRSIVEESQTIPAFPSPETSPVHASVQAQGRQQLAQTAPGPEAISHAQQAGPPTTAIPNQQMPAQAEKPRSGLSAWADFGASVAKHDADQNEKALQEHRARLAEAQRAGIKQEVQLPAFDETWKQVKTGDSAGQRKVIGALRTQHNIQPLNQNQPPLGDLPTEMFTKPVNLGPVAPQVRSRYQDIFEQNQRVVSAPLSMDRSTSPSPPPPETADHPAFIATSQRPLVNLPGSKPRFTGPRPTVRLPPTTVMIQQSPASEPRIPTARSVSQPPTTPSWQDKINGLFDRKPSPEKRFTDVLDFSSSKVPLEVVPVTHSATITLPPHGEAGGPPRTAKALEMPPKVVEEEDALFEERDFGSVPTVRVPSMAPVQAWVPAGPPRDYRARYMVLLDQHTMSILTSLPGSEEMPRGNGVQITIRIGNMSAPKTKVMSRSTGHGSPRSKPGNPSKGKPRHAPKSRDSSGTYNPSKPVHNGPTRSPVNGSSQQTRPKSNNSSISWARRASGIIS